MRDLVGASKPLRTCVLNNQVLVQALTPRPRHGFFWILTVTACLALFGPIASAQQLSKRLILKDGSYQLAAQWEVKGDRVRYLSSERNDWEELPNSMVDWPATEKWEKDRAAGVPSPEAVALDKELAEERASEEAKSPQVVPGLRLPEDGSVLLLDSFQTQPQLVELQQNGGELNRNRTQNIIRAVVIPIPLGSKQTIELDGLHATVQAHTPVPSIYVNLQPNQDSADASVGPQQPVQPQQPEQPWDRFRIVRTQGKKGKRIVGAININPLGKVSQKQTLVPTTCVRLTGGWVKVTPTATLEPGEYALVELLGREGMNTFVWDFGMDPAAPANAAAVKPGVTTSSQPSKPQDLQTRPR
ncbi:MAG: hypothetical protein LAO09_10650 [Acidobacteriia bacterium]|nr:hypothetical protein [Terriglobia bacterium]